MTPLPPTPADARCAAHPEQPALGPCARCGTFICAQDSRPIGPWLFCLPCAARPEFAWVAELRARWSSHRDGWFYVLALVALGVALAAVAGLVSAVGARDWRVATLACGLLVEVGCVVLHLRRQRWARFALWIWPLALGAAAVPLGLPEWTVGLVMGTLVVALPVTDVRHRVYLGLPESDEKIAAYWQRNLDNRPAQWGSLVAALGFCIPGAGLVAMGLGAWGIALANPTGTPPVGKRLQAWVALVLGLVQTVGMAVFAWSQRH